MYEFERKGNRETAFHMNAHLSESYILYEIWIGVLFLILVLFDFVFLFV